MVGLRVYVGGLPNGVRERDLERFFKGYGRTRDILLKNGYGFVEFDDHRDADDAVYELNGKKLLGKRIRVEYSMDIVRRGDRTFGRSSRHSSSWYDKVSVEKARGMPRESDAYQGSGHGRSLAPLPRRPSSVCDREPDYRSNDRYGRPTRTEYRLMVKNLSSSVSWQDLKDYMRQAGKVTYADAHKGLINKGFVEFATYSDMKNALYKLDDTELNGRRIRLVEDRQGDGRRSRSSSSRSRSRSRSFRTRSRSCSQRSSRSRSRRSSRSKSESRSHSRSISRGKDRSKSKYKSCSRSESKKQSRSKSRSQSVSKGKPNERSRSPSKEKSKSKSRSPQKNGDRSPEVQDN